MNRRVFLRGIGGAAVAAPFLPSIYEKTAKAQTAIPKRLVIFYTHNGCLTDKWFPKITGSNGNGALTADSITGGTLEVLKPYISKLTVPRGFRSMNAYGTGQMIDPHDQAMGSKLTCATIDQNKSRYATAASLDHVIAKQINPAGRKTPLVLSVGAASMQIKEILSFSDVTTPFPAIVNPTTVYNQLTGLFGTGGTGGTPTAEGNWRVLRGQSALDLVKNDLKRYQALKMSKVDQTSLKDWADLLRTTENGMTTTGTMTTTPTSCAR